MELSGDRTEIVNCSEHSVMILFISLRNFIQLKSTYKSYDSEQDEKISIITWTYSGFFCVCLVILVNFLRLKKGGDTYFEVFLYLISLNIFLLMLFGR